MEKKNQTIQPSVTAGTNTPDASAETDTKTGKPVQTKQYALSEKNLFDAYKDALAYTIILNDPFVEFQRIARNKPYAGLAKKFPRVAEGSTAAFIHQKPRQLIQKTPTGKVSNDDNVEWLDVVVQDKLDNEIVPYATEDYPVFEKAQSGLEQAFTVGCTITTAPFYNHRNGIWSPDMTMQFWGDVIVPQGYKSIKSMPYVFLRGWWPKERIEMLLANPEATKTGGWNLAGLSAVKDNESTKDEKSETPVEKARGLPENAIEIVVAHQDGVNAPIFTFEPSSQTILRTKKNPDPRGVKNVQALYGLVDGTNPFGYSIVELVGAWQNLMDNDVQAYQYNRAYNVDPAIIKRGQIGDNDLHPGAEFETSDENAGIDVVPLDSEALSSYPQTHEWQRSVLLNLLNSPNSTDDPEAPLGKTPKGITMAGRYISTDDLTLNQHVHDWFQEWAETAINIYFAEHKGKQRLTLSKAAITSLRQLAEEGKFDIKLLDGDAIIFDFDGILEDDKGNKRIPILRFSVDGGSSKLQDEASQLEALQSIKEDINQDDELVSMTGPLIKAKIYNKELALSGIHDSDDLQINIKQVEQQLKEQQAQQGQAEEPAAQQIQPPKVTIAFKDLTTLPPAARLKAQLQVLQDYNITTVTSEDLQPELGVANTTTPPSTTNQPVSAQPITPPIPPQEMLAAIANLQKMGIPEVMIPHAMQALTEHVPLEDIARSFQQEGA